MNAIIYTTNTGSAERYAKLLDMMLHGGEQVRMENLDHVLNWYRKQN